jgi:RNA polymerase primary sigma factor
MTSATPDGFALFLARIARTPLLLPAEELRLARRIERGDRAARQRLVEANLRLVVHVAKRFQSDDHGFALPDLVQEGTVGLLRAAERFDHRRGHRFSTYAAIWIGRSIGRAIAEKGRTIRLPAHVGRELRALEQEERRLLAELGRAPSADELAAATDRLPEDVLQARELRRTTLSLHEPAGGGEGIELGDLIAQDAAEAPDARAEAAARGAAVRAALERLPERERAVVATRYGFDDDPATVAETARRLRLRAGDVRRLEELALRKLRAAPGTEALAA